MNDDVIGHIFRQLLHTVGAVHTHLLRTVRRLLPTRKMSWVIFDQFPRS